MALNNDTLALETAGMVKTYCTREVLAGRDTGRTRFLHTTFPFPSCITISIAAVCSCLQFVALCGNRAGRRFWS